VLRTEQWTAQALSDGETQARQRQQFVIVGWIKFMIAIQFVQSNNKRKLRYIEQQSGIHFHISISLSADKMSH
jgi:hypothetical protein